jgi:hypothetical protein
MDDNELNKPAVSYRLLLFFLLFAIDTTAVDRRRSVCEELNNYNSVRRSWGRVRIVRFNDCEYQ